MPLSNATGNVTETGTTLINESTEPNGRLTAIQFAAEVSLRDYFAAASLNTLIYKCGDKDGGWDYVSVAVGAYGLADAMLKEREAK